MPGFSQYNPINRRFHSNMNDATFTINILGRFFSYLDMGPHSSCHDTKQLNHIVDIVDTFHRG